VQSVVGFGGKSNCKLGLEKALDLLLKAAGDDIMLKGKA
jgi:hypothetical protein